MTSTPAPDQAEALKASDLPRMPIGGRGFRLFLERPAIEAARVPRDRFWPGDTSPFRVWLTTIGFRVVRMTDHTVEYGAGEGRAYMQARYRLPRWCRRFHQELRRIAGEEGSREIPREACLALLDRVAPHTRSLGFGEQMRRRADEDERAADGFGPYGEDDWRYRERIRERDGRAFP
ncbi:MAG: hypothetical protein AB7G23_21540 [Vicinamibacterales bacterium]